MELDARKTLALVVDWAKEAGRLQCSYFRGGDLEIETKSGAADVVTKVDKMCERMLLERIGQHFPGHAVLGEETGMHDAGSDYCWVVDPLDGTNNYSQGLPIFTVSIALQFRGETVLGVVYAPYLDELYTAIRGEGAFRDGRRLHVAEKTALKYCVLGTGFPYDKDVNPVNNADNLARILPHIRGMRRMGTAAYDLCCTAAGFLDGYWEMGLCPWDVCAGELFVEEAGGIIRSFRGDRKISIMAGSPRVVDWMAAYVR